MALPLALFLLPPLLTSSSSLSLIPTASRRVSRDYQLRIEIKEGRGDKPRETFDGFKKQDFESLSELISSLYNNTLETKDLSTRGWNWGKTEINQDEVQFMIKDKLAFELPLDRIANSNIAGKTEVSMEFINPEQQQPVTNTGASTATNGKPKKNKTDELVEMRFYVPGTVEKGSDASAAGSGDEEDGEESAAAAFHKLIKNKADIGQVAGEGIVVFKEVLVLTPRGRYDIDMYPTFLRLRGKTYDYKILYQSIHRLFLLPAPDDVHVKFVIGLDPPIRQGQTRYPYLVLQFPREEEMDAELNLDEETIQEKYEGKLKKRYEEPTFRIVTNVFKVLSGKKLVTPTNYESSTQQQSVKCNVKAADGLLYPLDKAMIWVSKQPVHIQHNDVRQIFFSRVGGAVASSKTFDLKVQTKSGNDHLFQSLNREEHEKLAEHFEGRGLRVKNEINDDLVAANTSILSDEDEEMEDADFDGKKGRKSAKKAAAMNQATMEEEDSEGESSI